MLNSHKSQPQASLLPPRSFRRRVPLVWGAPGLARLFLGQANLLPGKEVLPESLPEAASMQNAAPLGSQDPTGLTGSSRVPSVVTSSTETSLPMTRTAACQDQPGQR